MPSSQSRIIHAHAKNDGDGKPASAGSQLAIEIGEDLGLGGRAQQALEEVGHEDAAELVSDVWEGKPGALDRLLTRLISLGILSLAMVPIILCVTGEWCWYSF